MCQKSAEDLLFQEFSEGPLFPESAEGLLFQEFAEGRLSIFRRSTIDLCLLNLPKRSSFKSLLKIDYHL